MLVKSIVGITILSVSTSLNTGKTPVERAARADAPVFCTQSIIIKGSTKKIWDQLVHIDGWNKWLPGVSRSKLNGELKPLTTFDWKASGVSIHSTLHTVKPYSQLSWTGKVYTIFAIHDWTFEEIDGNSTRVTTRESMQGVVANLFKRSFQRTLEKDMAQSLEVLKRTCE